MVANGADGKGKEKGKALHRPFLTGIDQRINHWRLGESHLSEATGFPLSGANRAHGEDQGPQF
jgi:hypothetical protein